MSAVMSLSGPCVAQNNQVARRPMQVSAQVTDQDKLSFRVTLKSPPGAPKYSILPGRHRLSIRSQTLCGRAGWCHADAFRRSGHLQRPCELLQRCPGPGCTSQVCWSEEQQVCSYNPCQGENLPRAHSSACCIHVCTTQHSHSNEAAQAA